MDEYKQRMLGAVSTKYFQKIQIGNNEERVWFQDLTANFNGLNEDKTVAKWTLNDQQVITISDPHESIEGTSHIRRVIAALKAEENDDVDFSDFPIAKLVTFEPA